MANDVSPGTVTVLNTNTGGIVKTLTVDDNPAILQVSPNGEFVYVPSTVTGNVDVIDTKGPKKTGKIGIGTTATSVAFTPDSSIAYVTDSTDQLVAVINTATNSVSSDISTGAASWFSAVYTPNPELVFVLDGADSLNTPQSLTIIEAGNVLTSFSLTGDFGVFALTPNGNYAYAPQTSVNGGPASDVQMFDTSTGAPVGNPITVGNQPVAVAMSHNGVKAYVTNTSDNTVSVIKIFPAQWRMGEPAAADANPRDARCSRERRIG